MFVCFLQAEFINSVGVQQAVESNVAYTATVGAIFYGHSNIVQYMV